MIGVDTDVVNGIGVDVVDFDGPKMFRTGTVGMVVVVVELVVFVAGGKLKLIDEVVGAEVEVSVVDGMVIISWGIK